MATIMAAEESGSSRQYRRPSLKGVSTKWMLWVFGCWLVIGIPLAPALPGGWLSLAVLAVATSLPVRVLFRRSEPGHYPGAWTRLLLLRPFWYGQLFLPLLAAAALLGLLAGTVGGRPLAAGQWSVITMASLLALSALAGWIGSRLLTVKRLTAHFPDLPPGLEGLTIGQISDTHIGPQTSKRHLARAARLLGREAPDLIAVTGDLIDDFARDVDHYAAALGHLSAPLGVFAVPGNHDIYAGWTAVKERLVRLPLHLLVNENRRLVRGDTPFFLIGTGDPAGRYWTRDGGAEAAPDLPRALRGITPGAFTIALAHNPNLWTALATAGVHLTLSGHTHWGQFALPPLRWSLASPFLKHAMGAYAENGALLYIHPGTNFWGIPFRIGAHPEVTIITLRRGDRAAIDANRH
jgi:uncharacterized protein